MIERVEEHLIERTMLYIFFIIHSYIRRYYDVSIFYSKWVGETEYKFFKSLPYIVYYEEIGMDIREL